MQQERVVTRWQATRLGSECCNKSRRRMKGGGQQRQVTKEEGVLSGKIVVA
jgi:hypothetical protein